MKKLLLAACTAALMMACAQKQQAVVQVPPSQIDVEKLLDSIDYDMDVSGLSLADVRTLRNAPAAQRATTSSRARTMSRSTISTTA